MNHIGISLGRDCLPAGYGVTHGYRQTKENNYKTCPFDLMGSCYTGLINCIKEDFANFTNPAFLFVNENNLIVNTYYDFGFNHESPYLDDSYLKEKWTEGPYHFVNNNYLHFIERYNKRISNFRSYLSDENNFITFILHPTHHSNYENNCKELQEALSFTYPNLLYKILVIEGPTNPHVIEKTSLVKIIEKGS
jgi:hypothetical protein